MPEKIFEQRYELIIKPYGVRIERNGKGVDLTPLSLLSLQVHGQNAIIDAARLIEQRLRKGV